MIKIEITGNESDQRLDRFLRKYLKKAPLSLIYKTIRKDAKVNGKRGKEDTILKEGDIVSLYFSDNDIRKFRQDERTRKKTKKQFETVYEDENIIIVNKPFGLLTHGDGREKKNHLANQVVDYLIAEGKYNPRREMTFTPAPANRLDRNTTGLVIFGKTAESLRELNRLIKEGKFISKYYLTITGGNIEKELYLKDRMVKDCENNRVTVLSCDEDRGYLMETVVRPVENARGYTLAEVQIITGRTHQIRAHLAKEGYPVIGDRKYGDFRINKKVSEKYGLNTQLLHAYRLVFEDCEGLLSYMNGKVIEAEPPSTFAAIQKDIFG